MARRAAASTARAGGATTVPALNLTGNQVLVRMYGQGLGDCFLLAFPRGRAGAPDASGRPVYVLIDCGVIAGTPDGPKRMKRIVRDIRETTLDPAVTDAQGKPMGHLDLLIATHEHWDHLSGFLQAEEEWAGIHVDALWTAWTEKDDPDGLPGVLKKILARHTHAVAAVADRALRFGLSAQHGTVLGLNAFLQEEGSGGMAFGTRGVRDAFAAAKALVAKEAHVCCEPGEVHRVPGTEALAYVLGPPRSDALLRLTDRRAETFAEEEEAALTEGQPALTPAAAATDGARRLAARDPLLSLRGMAGGRSGINAFVMPLLDPSTPFGAAGGDEGAMERDLYKRSFPFDATLRVPLPLAERTVAAEPEAYPALASYYDDLNHWRRVDFDWLGSAEAFALQADNLTNNTSLVLAFELPAAVQGQEGKVLLFVADAQVGNWLSWDEITAWQPQADVPPIRPGVTAENLLRRSVFYKVGHHGSHNATLKAKGVDRMPGDGTLTAFVPVSVEVARELKDWCEMPLSNLLDTLSARTGGRVVLPNGNVWPPVPAAQLDAVRQSIGVEVSSEKLPPKGEIEGEVPLWVQTAIAY